MTNILVVVVRYFGGTKLGVGGLINAYKTATKLALESAIIVNKNISCSLKLNFEYAHMNKIMRVIKENNLEISNQKMELNCEIIVVVEKKNRTKVMTSFEGIRALKFQEIKT